MDYWILLSERSDEYELTIDGLPECMEEYDLKFSRGRKIESLPCDTIVLPYTQAEDEFKSDNIVCAPSLGLVINRRLRLLFESLGLDNIQYFPLVLQRDNPPFEEHDYCIANITGVHGCVDFENSSLTLFNDGTIMFIDSLHLKFNEDTDYGDIFRLSEYTQLIVISSRVREALEKEKITGLKIYAPEDLIL